MMIIIILVMYSEPELDSMVNQLGVYPLFEAVININNEYLRHNAFNKAITLLRSYENTYPGEFQARIEYALAENYFYESTIMEARNQYMSMAQRHTASIEANNALERLYQIEGMRTDTVIMKKIMYAICLFETGRYDASKDSLLKLVNSKLGDQSYDFLAGVYRERGDLPMALGALLAIDEQFPNCRIIGLPILKAEIYIDTKDREKAIMILENFLVQDPISVFAVKARQLLNKIRD